jgi:hypothetical protein
VSERSLKTGKLKAKQGAPWARNGRGFAYLAATSTLYLYKVQSEKTQRLTLPLLQKTNTVV